MIHLRLVGKTGGSEILIGKPLARLPELVGRERNAVIVTDENVARLYATSFPSWPVVTIPPGEQNKNLPTVLRIYRRFLELGVDRQWLVVAVGGGVVCDVAGFAASTYLRGLEIGFVPTTLLAQVDAALGGKNGVNFYGYKNLVGTFRQPRFVLCDFETLRSLPLQAVRSGLAEVIKAAAIADRPMFGFLEKNIRSCLNLDRKAIAAAVARSCRVKIDIVSRDEQEAGERRKLNFGHTVGHALEKISRLDHGEAVAIGMAIAARLSVRKGLLAKEEEARLIRLLKEAGLPVTLRIKPSSLGRALLKDKKRENRNIHFVFLSKLGQAVVEKIVPQEIIEAAHDLR